MKQKLLSLLLVITLIAITVSVAFPTTLAENEENLIVNGDFSSISGNAPDNWRFSIRNNTKAQLVKDVEIKSGLVKNAIKFETSADGSSRNTMVYKDTVSIEKNAKYTMSFWVKAINIKGFRTYMFEPTYVALDGTTKTANSASEGQNIYTYNYNSGSTRVCRTDVAHRWYVAETGVNIDNSAVSMFIARSNGASQVLTPDYPTYARQGEWLQVVHEFTTGNSDAHVAEISYQFDIPENADGELWIADVRMSVEKEQVDGYYTPSVNDPTLGTASPADGVPLYTGKEATVTAEPFGENKFLGWYDGNELVTDANELTFTYDPANPPQYQARFEKADFGIDGSIETLTKGQVVAQAVHSKDPGTTDSNWTETSFLGSEKAGSGFYVDSHYGGTWRKATVTEDKAHTGKKSLLFTGQYGAIGYKFTGLNKNADYILSVYAFLTADASKDWAGVANLIVTGGNVSATALRTNGKYDFNNVNPLVFKYGKNDAVTKGWTKFEVEVNTKDNEEVIFWLDSNGLNAKLYLDNYSIKRAPFKFKPVSEDYDLGFVSPVEGADAVEGQDVTVTATPIDGNGFDGWYADGVKVSGSMTYTHKFDPETSTKLTARFIKGANSPAGAGLESGYTDGQLLATYGHPTGWSETAYIDGSETGEWFVDSTYNGTWRNATISTEKAHSGKFAVKYAGQYGFIGRKFTGLKPNTSYAVSFYALTNADTSTPDFAGVNNIIITTANQSAVYKDSNGKMVTRTAVNSIAKDSKSYACVDTWTKITVPFTTGDATDIILWIHSSGTNAKLYLDNFGIYEPITGSVSAGLGGDITHNVGNGSIPTGYKVELSATPLEGNTFAGWVDTAGNVVSTDPNYTFTAEGNFTLTAKFEGYNMPAYDLFAAAGQDGTFENGTISGFFADDPTYGDSVSWVSWKRSTVAPYEGAYSLELNGRYRDNILPLTGLVTNTNYRLSFYVCQPDADIKASIGSMGIAGGSNDTHLGFATSVLTTTRATNLIANTGWYKVDLYFNSAEFTEANFIFRYNTDDTKTRVYMDNLTLYQFAGNEALLNGKFDDGKESWIGDFTVTDGVANIKKGDKIYQTLLTSERTRYTVKFRAKGDVTASVQDLASYSNEPKKYITSQSVATASGSEWKDYTIDFYTGAHRAGNLVFTANGDAQIDDVTFAVNVDSAGAVLEKIDFETERFDLINSPDSFSIYYATDSNDKNVYAGNRSLKFTYNPALAATEFAFDETYAAFETIGGYWRISFKYKIADGNQGGMIRIAPDSKMQFGADVGFEHNADDDGWYTVSYFFNNLNTSMFTKCLIASIGGSTMSDFYIDDIVISVAPPMVSETGTKLSYCEALYNVVDNESFEKPFSEKDWKGATSNMKRVKGKAQKGEHFLRVSANTHYVLELDVKPETEYFFAASVRGTAATKGFIGISTNAEGTSFYSDIDEKPASIIQPKAGSTAWERSAFRFSTNATGKAYLVIEATAGEIDIDSVMFFTSEYAYRYDPNDYTVYVPYDYDNLKGPTVVINGGFGNQPYYEEEAGGEISAPDTGDTLAAPVIAIVLAAFAAAIVLVARKRKEGVEE